MTAIEPDDDGNGQGVVQSSVVLYRVSEKLNDKKNKDANRKKKKKVVQEPRDRNYIWFFLNQSYLRTQEMKETQLMNLNPAAIDSENKFISSIIYEEYGSNAIRLSFVTASITKET